LKRVLELRIKSETGVEYPEMFQSTKKFYNQISVKSTGLNYTVYTDRENLYIYIQGVTGGKDQTSGGCSLC